MSEITTNAASFARYLDVLRSSLPYVEDNTFAWADVCAFLIIHLKNTDSLNKERDASHATQIQITSESSPIPGLSKTEDFFPTMTLNSSFKSWRIALSARIHMGNVFELVGSTEEFSGEAWQDDTVQIRRRLLNESADNPGNPTLQICYGNDLLPLREKLNVGDYLVFVKRRLATQYEVFGLRSGVDLGEGKRLYKSDRASNDSTVFSLTQLTEDKADRKAAANYFDRIRRVPGGLNTLLYGVPGAGKSWTIAREYCSDETRMERLVFHPDYTYSDFVGQIMPKVENGSVSYRFVPGPFTKLLKKAYEHPETEYFLIIEEINRGNAPAIFGEVFQLLDRKAEPDESGYPVGTSEYGITNENVASIVYGDPDRLVRIPSNMSIIGTMNTSDQNVFTLDTAFQRRWNMRLIENTFEGHRFADNHILDTDISWRQFCESINREILKSNVRMTSSEDKRLGAFFITAADLVFNAAEDDENATEPVRIRARRDNRRFAEKVIKYLWDDAFKFNRENVFETNSFISLEQLIREFMDRRGNERFRIFKEGMFNAIVDQADGTTIQ